MKEDMIMVESACNWTVVIDVPEIPLRRTWPKMGTKYPIERDLLERAFYQPGVDYLFKEGLLVTNDKQFLVDVGLISEGEEDSIVHVSEAYFNRMIKLMPLSEFKQELPKLTHSQQEQLADYAIEHYTDLSMDRIDILSKACNKNIFKAIEQAKQDQEG